MHEMQFRCIIKQFTYLNSFWYSLCPFFRFFCLPFLSYRLISFNFEVLLLLFLRLFVNAREKFNKKRYKNSSVFWLNSIKLFFFFWFSGLLAGFTLVVHSSLSLGFRKFLCVFPSKWKCSFFYWLIKLFLYFFRLEISGRLCLSIRLGDEALWNYIYTSPKHRKIRLINWRLN